MLSRAQYYDVLSSQANIAGYRSVIEAANRFPWFFAGQMTAARTVPFRAVTKEQVESIDATFLEVKVEEDGAGAGGGYAKVQFCPCVVLVEWFGCRGVRFMRFCSVLSVVAIRLSGHARGTERWGQWLDATSASARWRHRNEGSIRETCPGKNRSTTPIAFALSSIVPFSQEMPDKHKAVQARLMLEQASNVDVIVTTTLIPGQKAPVLVNEEMLDVIKPRSVIVDLAVANGGNVVQTEANKVRGAAAVGCLLFCIAVWQFGGRDDVLTRFCSLLTASLRGQFIMTDNGVTFVGYTDLQPRLVSTPSFA
ncbi:hypothetical protein ACHAWF_017112 [Thalassiosira exigua]